MDNELRSGRCRHTKGARCEVLGMASHSETKIGALQAIPCSLAENCASDRRNS
jgi:hypothetical protein